MEKLEINHVEKRRCAKALGLLLYAKTSPEIQKPDETQLGMVQRYLRITPAQATRLVNYAERNNWIKTKPDPDDLRRSVITVTEAGQRYFYHSLRIDRGPEPGTPALEVLKSSKGAEKDEILYKFLGMFFERKPPFKPDRDCIPLSEIQATMGYLPAAVSRLLKKHEEAGNITIQHNGEDKRCHDITITGKGREAFYALLEKKQKQREMATHCRA